MSDLDRFVVKSGILGKVCELYQSFGNAFVYTEEGGRYLVNEGTEGIEFASLKEGDLLVCDIAHLGYVVRATRGKSAKEQT